MTNFSTGREVGGAFREGPDDSCNTGLKVVWLLRSFQPMRPELCRPHPPPSRRRKVPGKMRNHYFRSRAGQGFEYLILGHCAGGPKVIRGFPVDLGNDRDPDFACPSQVSHEWTNASDPISGMNS